MPRTLMLSSWCTCASASFTRASSVEASSSYLQSRRSIDRLVMSCPQPLTVETNVPMHGPCHRGLLLSEPRVQVSVGRLELCVLCVLQCKHGG